MNSFTRPTKDGGVERFEDSQWCWMHIITDADGNATKYEVCPRLQTQKSRGLGDTIAKFTRKTRLDKMVQWYEAKTGKPCGCRERKEKWNKKYPYGKSK